MKPRHSRSSLLLTEILIAIVFFALISAMCLQIFVKAHTLSTDARAIMLCETQAESMITVIRSAPTEDVSALGELLSSYMEGIFPKETGVCIGYAKDLTVCEPEKAAYLLSVTPEEAPKVSGLYSYTIRLEKASKEAEPLAVTEFSAYAPDGREVSHE